MSKQVTQRLIVEVITDKPLSAEQVKATARALETAANRSASIVGTGGFFRVPRAEGFERNADGGWTERPYR